MEEHQEVEQEEKWEEDVGEEGGGAEEDHISDMIQHSD